MAEIRFLRAHFFLVHPVDTDIFYNVQVQDDSARVPPRPGQGRGERGECGHGGGGAEAAGTR